MRIKRKVILSTLVVLIVAGIVTGLAFAEDGKLYRRNISKTPAGETEKSAIFMMDFYVPAQSSTGEVGPVDDYLYYENDNAATANITSTLEPRDYAKPLISVYIDDLPEDTLLGAVKEILGIDAPEAPTIIDGGIVLGHFDGFVGVSLDDGDSWKTTNLSESAHESSFILDNGQPYPGTVHALVHQVAEDKILVAWASKYCQSGFPLYALSSTEAKLDLNQPYLADLEATYGKNALYLYDLFGVAGNQGSVNYTEQGFPDVGEVPYSCIWTVRGKLLPGDDPKTEEFVEASHIVWTTPERLTSGKRDANLPAVDCAGGAGCALTWQEDPEGLRPGQGLGPGEGWSGAVANAKTDIWYSYITFADFDYVTYDENDDGIIDPVTEPAMLVEDYEAMMVEQGLDVTRPKPYVPMAIPVRLTDNDMCRASGDKEDPFCWIDFDTIDDVNSGNIWDFLADIDDLNGPEPGADFCASTYTWTNPQNVDIELCVTEDGRYMVGRVAATRVRMILKPYTPLEAVDLDGDGIVEKSAWLSLAAEESKALGGTAEVDGTEYDPVDIGKDMFYYSFDYAKPYNLHVNLALDAVDDSAYIVQQGGLLNQPAKCSPWFIVTDMTNPAITCPEDPELDGEFFDVMIDEETGYEYYLTEIARRFALTLNSINRITDETINQSGLAGILIYKQGIINQGGPADIMLRRLVVPDDFDAAVDNPFAYENMVCEYPDGTSAWVYPTAEISGTLKANPNYLMGLCMAPAINITGSTIVRCTEAEGNDACAAKFPVADDGSIPDTETDADFPKVFEWRNCDGLAAIDGCDNTDDPGGDLDDQTWENPYDVSKGHRGFLYGDMVMMMYAWAPNWKSNTVGNDHYNLYQRRSFDGGLTWTTTPADWCQKDENGDDILGTCGAGMDALEIYYGDTIGQYEPYVWSYGPGEFEQGRNLSLLTGNKITILDPRYSPPGSLKQYGTISTAWLEANADIINFTSDDVLPYTDDNGIDPSKYYMVYETGDNTTVAEGEAVPLDLYYSRATVFGDFYEWFDYTGDADDCNPLEGVVDLTTPAGELGTDQCIPRWPWLENAIDDLSGEASVIFNQKGTFAYNVWNQWREEILPDGHELIFDSDMWFRRLLWISDDLIQTSARIVFVSSPMIDVNQDLLLIGQASSPLGIEEVVWTDNDVVVGADFQLTVPSGMTPGWHQFGFKAKDKGGRWSPGVTVDVLVAETTYKTYMPFATYASDLPTVSIVFVSSEIINVADELILEAEVFSALGIEEMVWTLNGVPIDGANSLILRVPPGNLHPGWQQFGFKAKDKGGRWSPGVTVLIYVED